MASSPKSSRNVQDMREAPAPLDFRAPPPSPTAASRRASSVANDDVLTDFLHHSLHVPDLVLPDRLFPRLLRNPDRVVPTVDFRSLIIQGSEVSEVARESLESTGCFQLVNHGVSGQMLQAAVFAAAGIFRLPPERKKTVERSPEMGFGFEVVGCGGEEDEHVDMCEEFVWYDDDGFKLKFQQIWPNGFANFSDKMERLSSAIEEVSRAIIQTLNKLDDHYSITTRGQGLNCSSSPVCYIYKHTNNIPAEQCISSFRYDVIRMMIQGSNYPHTLSLHVCEAECSEFHVYSKKGWVSFTPTPNALIVTAGDQMQTWSGGKYKHVIGRAIYTSEQEEENFISMAFLCSPSISTFETSQHKLEEDEYIITLPQQALFAILITFACQFLHFLYLKL